jgi:hypothetical protein
MILIYRDTFIPICLVKSKKERRSDVWFKYQPATQCYTFILKVVGVILRLKAGTIGGDVGNIECGNIECGNIESRNWNREDNECEEKR